PSPPPRPPHPPPPGRLPLRPLPLRRRGGGHLRHLLSLPTRRSSDLFPRVAGSSVIILETARALGLTLPLTAVSLPVSASPRLVWGRKSTRLNSSHEWTSDAAFCLHKRER